jgi:kinesin family protein 1
MQNTEIARGAKELIRMQGNQTFLDPPEPAPGQGGGRATERKTMTFSFDKSYWSAGDRGDPDYCSQQTLYDDLGKELLDHGFAGFNACILACEWSLYCVCFRSGCSDIFVLRSRIDGQTGEYFTLFQRKTHDF